jgi:hypothetical protein
MIMTLTSPRFRANIVVTGISAFSEDFFSHLTGTEHTVDNSRLKAAPLGFAYDNGAATMTDVFSEEEVVTNGKGNGTNGTSGADSGEQTSGSTNSGSGSNSGSGNGDGGTGVGNTSSSGAKSGSKASKTSKSGSKESTGKKTSKKTGGSGEMTDGDIKKPASPKQFSIKMDKPCSRCNFPYVNPVRNISISDNLL